MGRANFVLIRTDHIAKGDYESYDDQNGSTVTMCHSMPPPSVQEQRGLDSRLGMPQKRRTRQEQNELFIQKVRKVMKFGALDLVALCYPSPFLFSFFGMVAFCVGCGIGRTT